MKHLLPALALCAFQGVDQRNDDGFPTDGLTQGVLLDERAAKADYPDHSDFQVPACPAPLVPYLVGVELRNVDFHLNFKWGVENLSNTPLVEGLGVWTYMRQQFEAVNPTHGYELLTTGPSYLALAGMNKLLTGFDGTNDGNQSEPSKPGGPSGYWGGPSGTDWPPPTHVPFFAPWHPDMKQWWGGDGYRVTLRHNPQGYWYWWHPDTSPTDFYWEDRLGSLITSIEAIRYWYDLDGNGPFPPQHIDLPVTP